MKSSPVPEPSFEDALGKLEVLVNQMETGEVALEEMVSRFEEGTRLLNFCVDKLRSAERRIEVLKQERRSLEIERFEPDAP